MSFGNDRPHGSLQRTAIRSIGWVAADRWASRAISLVVFALLGRLLDASEFGLLAMAMTITILSNMLTDAGFGKAIIQRADLNDEHLDAAFWANLLLSLLLTVAIIASAPLVERGFGIDGLAPVLMAMAATVMIEALSAVPNAILEREFRFQALALRRVVSMSAGGAVAVALALAGAGVWSLVAQSILSSVVATVVLWVATPWRPSFSFSLPAARELWSVGGHLTGMEIIGFLSSQGDKLLIGAAVGPTGLGYYFFGSRLVSMGFELFAGILSRISLTTFSCLQTDSARQLRVFFRFVSASALLNIPLFLILSAIADVLIPFVFGDQWAPAVPVFQILCLLSTINAVAGFDQHLLVSGGHARPAFLLAIAQTLFCLVVLLAALPFGVIWIAVAAVAGPYLFWPVRLLVLRRIAGVPPAAYLHRWWRPMLAGATAFAVIIAVNHLWPQVRAHPPLYLIAMPLLGGLVYLITIVYIARQMVIEAVGGSAAFCRIASLIALHRNPFRRASVS